MKSPDPARTARPMRRVRRSVAAALAITLTLIAAACTGSGSSGSRTGGVVTLAEQPGLAPSYIFPFYSTAYAEYNNQNWFEWLMWRPLFWFGQDGKMTLNEGLSIANPPTFSSDGMTVTITLKTYSWSDGTPVTNRDVEFWYNLLVANKSKWASYVPDQFPDNVTRASFPSATPDTFSFTFDKAYDQGWLLSNQLGQLWAIPQHAWDRTSASGTVGNYDRTPQDAQSVYKFMDGQSRNQGTYATNPLWQVVDGPWKLSEFDSTGKVTFVPNEKYSGPDKPKLDQFQELPFTSSSSELNALLAGDVDYGYLPVSDLGARAQLEAKGYATSTWPYYGINYAVYNYSNPTIGPVFKQQYIRETFSHLVDQDSYVKNIYHGFAVPTYGPMPASAGSYLSNASKTNPYPFDIATAAAELTSHGWNVAPGGVTTCAQPGTGPSNCGAGIGAGAKLVFSLQYASGYPEAQQEVEALKSDASKVGIVLNLSSAPNAALYSTLNEVCPQSKSCPWNIIYYYPGGWYWGVPETMPTGDIPFGTSPLSAPGWTDPVMGAAANLPMTQGVSGLMRYQDVVETLAPVLWMPTPPTQISVISKRLLGVGAQDPSLNIYPEQWSLVAT